jgi:HSP90 family molecular chaperone
MLGDQLIKNAQVALVELIKNAYDADADNVKISFKGFNELGDRWEKTGTASIVIEDDGLGMTEETVKQAWLNPATPYKKHDTTQDRRTRKGRVMQGEKGIGRFAMLKLGKKITLITRAENAFSEIVVSLNFSNYDDEFTKKDGKLDKPFLDELRAQLYLREPELFKG